MSLGKSRYSQVQNPAQSSKICFDKDDEFCKTFDEIENSMTMEPLVQYSKYWEKSRAKRPKQSEDQLYLYPRCTLDIRKHLNCRICGKKGEHSSDSCSYIRLVPEGADITPEASLFCTCCHVENGHPDRAFQAYAKLKRCIICVKVGDHWVDKCPYKEKLLDPFKKYVFGASEKPRRRPSTFRDNHSTVESNKTF